MTRKFAATVDPSPSDGLPTDAIARQLALLPAIQDALTELRLILSGKAKNFLTVEEVASEVGRAPYTVREWIKSGRLNALRVSGTGPKGRLLVPREELRKLIESAGL